jgi:hypothetical protein
MSELSKLTGAGNTTALPGYTLSPPGLRELGEAESEFARSYLADVTAGAKDSDPETRKSVLKEATLLVANSHFNYYGVGFGLACMSARHIPFLVWLAARINKPDLTREQAEALLTRENEPAISRVVLEIMGVVPDPNARAGDAKEMPKESPSTPPPGEASSDSSATSDNLATSKSAA